jgi:ketosteroid isomerase-like protein
MTHRDQVKQAFALLRRQGWIARLDYKDCRACAANDVTARLVARGLTEWEIPEANVAFYSRADADAFHTNGDLKRDMYVSWNGDLKVLLAAFDEAGLIVEEPVDDRHSLRIPVPAVRIVWNPYARDGAGGFWEERWSQW